MPHDVCAGDKFEKMDNNSIFSVVILFVSR